MPSNRPRRSTNGAGKRYHDTTHRNAVNATNAVVQSMLSNTVRRQLVQDALLQVRAAVAGLRPEDKEGVLIRTLEEITGMDVVLYGERRKVGRR